MQRFLKRRAEEDVDLNRDAGTHAQVPLEKRGSLLRYMFISRSASMEVEAVDKPTPRENHGLLRYMSTSGSASMGVTVVARNAPGKVNGLLRYMSNSNSLLFW